LTAGENRNFDLRREFHESLDAAHIASTAIFNGAFAEILTYNVSMLDFKKKTVGYWGNPDHFMHFTAMDDTAAFTAAASLDPATPRVLRIASFQVSANDLVRFTADILKTLFELVCFIDRTCEPAPTTGISTSSTSRSSMTSLRSSRSSRPPGSRLATRLRASP
jgi:hypothetical protein